MQLDQASHIQLSHFTHHPQFLLWLPRDLDLAVAGEQQLSGICSSPPSWCLAGAFRGWEGGGEKHLSSCPLTPRWGGKQNLSECSQKAMPFQDWI